MNLTRDMGRFMKMLSKTWQRAALDTKQVSGTHDAYGKGVAEGHRIRADLPSAALLDLGDVQLE